MGEKADNKFLFNFLFNKVIGIWLGFVVKMGYFSINIDGRRAVVRGFYRYFTKWALQMMKSIDFLFCLCYIYLVGIFMESINFTLCTPYERNRVYNLWYKIYFEEMGRNKNYAKTFTDSMEY